MGHEEPLLGLVRGARVLLAEAQTDLVLGLRAAVLQVGPQFCGHRDCRGWAKMGRPTWCPPCAHIPCPCPMSPHPHCAHPCPMPTSTFHVPHPCPLPVLTPHALCPYAHCSAFMPIHAHCHSPMPILCPVPLLPTLRLAPCPMTTHLLTPLRMPPQCPKPVPAYISHMFTAISVPSSPGAQICSHSQYFRARSFVSMSTPCPAS